MFTTTGATEVTIAQFEQYVTATGYRTDAERGDGSETLSGYN
jgi:formylglycine-generating enzyme required for sulfatase activity